MLVFTRFAFDFDLGFFYVCFNHPQEVDLFIPKILFYNNSQMVPPHGKGSNNEAGGSSPPELSRSQH
jgi:hypothetical protein